ncbi:Hsp70 family protein [Kitasatospora phosalacinea]|uniref:Hsp70 family protein n=1 Tax=Kitasatospora phosalacinea TaxID=2065 RepID=A0ABW6GFL4_9ACTN
MQEPVLVVDFGTSSSAAAVVTDRGERLVKEPSSGLLSWPSAVAAGPDGVLLVGSAAERRKRAEPEGYRAEFKRDLGESAPVPLGGRNYSATALVAAVLAEFRAQAGVMTGRAVGRLVVTVPASYGPVDPRRDAMLAAGREAGFESVELLAEPVAAAHAAVVGEPFGPGRTVLVYDFGGGTFDTALVRFDAAGVPAVLGHAALDDCGGRDVDALLAGRIRERGREWLEPLLGAGGAGALRARLELGDFVRRIKHQLTESGEVEDYLTPLGPASRVARTELDALIAPLLERTVACCQRLLADCGVRAKDVDAVLLVGGTTRVPAVRALLAQRLGRPLRQVEDPDLAVVHGAAAWAARAADRRLTPVELPLHTRPLAWNFPGGNAELAEWTVPPGATYEPGDTLGALRLPDGSLWSLTASAAGRVEAPLVEPGTAVAPGAWLLAVRPRTTTADPDADPADGGGTGRPDRTPWPGRTAWTLAALAGAGLLAYGLAATLTYLAPTAALLVLLGYAGAVLGAAGAAAGFRGAAGGWQRLLAGVAVLLFSAQQWWKGGWYEGAPYRVSLRPPLDGDLRWSSLLFAVLMLLGTGLSALALTVRRRRRGDAVAGDAVASGSGADRSRAAGAGGLVAGLVGAVLGSGTAAEALAWTDWTQESLADTTLPLVLLPVAAAGPAGAWLVRGLRSADRALWTRGAAVAAVALVVAWARHTSSLSDGLVLTQWPFPALCVLTAAAAGAGLALAAEPDLPRVAALPGASWVLLWTTALLLVVGVVPPGLRDEGVNWLALTSSPAELAVALLLVGSCAGAAAARTGLPGRRAGAALGALLALGGALALCATQTEGAGLETLPRIAPFVLAALAATWSVRLARAGERP